MLTIRKITLAALPVLGGALLLGRPAAAFSPSFTFTLDNNGVLTITRPLTGSTTGSLDGTVVNQTANTLNFNYSVHGAFDAANDLLQPILLPPFSLGPQGSTHYDFADFTVTSTTPLGLYDLNGGTTTGNNVSLSDGSLTIPRVYSVNVVAPMQSAVPEPSPLATFSLGALGLGGLFLAARRRKA